MSKLIIEAGRADQQYWRDLWRYRELFYFLAWRDILVRYKQTVIGVAWALLRPLLIMLIFTALRRVAGLTSVIPGPILVFAALLPWQFFSTALSEASGSLIGNANLISKVYFPGSSSRPGRSSPAWSISSSASSSWSCSWPGIGSGPAGRS